MKTGDLVKVMYGITDPKNKQGEVGEVIKMEVLDEDNILVWIRFEDEVEGVYDINCLEKKGNKNVAHFVFKPAKVITNTKWEEFALEIQKEKENTQSHRAITYVAVIQEYMIT